MNKHGKRLKEVLRNGITHFAFTKKDGGLRTMVATLKPGFIPEEKQPSGDRKQSQDETECELVKCYDLEAQGWRSFRADTLISYYDDISGTLVMVKDVD